MFNECDEDIYHDQHLDEQTRCRGDDECYSLNCFQDENIANIEYQSRFHKCDHPAVKTNYDCYSAIPQAYDSTLNCAQAKLNTKQ